MAKKSIHKGLRAYRLNDDNPSGMRESAFAEQWRKEQEWGLLGHLLSKDNTEVSYSDRDAEVAATVIQWLGTNVGQGFLRKVQENIEAKEAELQAQATCPRCSR